MNTKKRTKICIVAGLAMIATASGVAFAKSERYTVTAASVPTNGYVETITLQDLKVDHWGTPNSATEKTTDDPIYDGFTATGKYSMPVGTPGQRHLNGAYGAKGSWKYVSSTAGTFGYKFKMDFGDGDFTGCLNFSIGDTAIGIFDDRFATVGKRWNVASTDADRYVEYSKTYTGIQDVSIQYQCVSPTAEDTVDDALGKLYVLTIGADEYQIYHAYDGNSWHPIEFGNYTNEVIDLYSTEHMERDSLGMPINSYIKTLETTGLEEGYWGTPKSDWTVTNSPIYDWFTATGKYTMPYAATGSQSTQLYTAWGQAGSWREYYSANGFAYKFKMNFGDGDFAGCLYLGIANTAVGIFDDRVATVSWANNNASTVDGRYATYNKSYTGVQDVSVRLEGVFLEDTYENLFGKLYTITIGTDEYQLYYDDTLSEKKCIALANYTDENLDLYVWNYVERDENGVPVTATYEEEAFLPLENLHWGNRALGGTVAINDPIFDAFNEPEKYVMETQESGTEPKLYAANSRLGSLKMEDMSTDYGYKFRMDFGNGDFTGCLYFQVYNEWVGIFSDKFAKVRWATNSAYTTQGRYVEYSKTYTGVQDVSISYRNVFDDEVKIGNLYTLTIGEDKYSFYYACGPQDGTEKVALANYTNISLYLYAWNQQSYVERLDELKNSINSDDYYSEQLEQIEELFTAARLEAPHYVAEDYENFLAEFNKILKKGDMDALREKIAGTKNELENSVSQADYFDAEWVEVQALLSSTKSKLDLCNNESQITLCVDEFKDLLHLIRSKAVYALIDERTEDLLQFASSANVEHYSNEDYQKIGEICESAKNDLALALTVDDVDRVYFEAHLELVSLYNTAVANYKTTKVSLLNASYLEKDYDSETWLIVQSKLETYALAIENCTDLEDIDTCMELAKLDLDDVITLAELEALKSKKEAAIAEISSVCDKKDYTEENWNTILGIIQSASDEINECGTIAQIDEKVVAVKASLDAIEKVKGASSSDDKKSGCSSALGIGGIGLGVTLLVVVSFFIIRKKKRQK